MSLPLVPLRPSTLRSWPDDLVERFRHEHSTTLGLNRAVLGVLRSLVTVASLLTLLLVVLRAERLLGGALVVLAALLAVSLVAHLLLPTGRHDRRLSHQAARRALRTVDVLSLPAVCAGDDLLYPAGLGSVLAGLLSGPELETAVALSAEFDGTVGELVALARMLVGP